MVDLQGDATNLPTFSGWFFRDKFTSSSVSMRKTGWWFQIFFFQNFTPSCGNDPIWLYNIFSDWVVDITNQENIFRFSSVQKTGGFIFSTGPNGLETVARRSSNHHGAAAICREVGEGFFGCQFSAMKEKPWLVVWDREFLLPSYVGIICFMLFKGKTSQAGWRWSVTIDYLAPCLQANPLVHHLYSICKHPTSISDLDLGFSCLASLFFRRQMFFSWVYRPSGSEARGTYIVPVLIDSPRNKTSGVLVFQTRFSEPWFWVLQFWIRVGWWVGWLMEWLFSHLRRWRRRLKELGRWWRCFRRVKVYRFP